MSICCPSLTNYSSIWDDQRNPLLPRGYVIHKPSGDLYGLTNDSNQMIRLKMALLCIFSPLFTLQQMALRIKSIVTGRWLQHAQRSALRSWRKERYLCHQAIDRPLPDRKELEQRTTKLAFRFLAEATLKCATVPLATLLKMAVCWLSIPDPLLARRLFGNLEEIWSAHPEEESSAELILSNYSATCMQPKRVWDQFNFYRFSKKYDWQDSRSLMYRINRSLDTNKEYFPEDIYTSFKTHFNPKLAKSLPKGEKNLINIERKLGEFIEHSYRIAQQDVFDKEAETERQNELRKEEQHSYKKISAYIEP